MEKQQKQARTAGLLYLALVVLGIFNLIVIPGQYVARGDPVATITNIQAMEPTFRMGIIVGVVSDAVYILLAFAFYQLLAPVGRTAATLLVVFAAAGAGLGLVSAGAKLNVLTVLDTAPFLQVFTAEQLQAQAILSLRSYSNLLRVAELFWGLWLFPLGLLVYRSGFLPRALGVLLMAGAFGYATSFFANVLWPVYSTTSLSMLIPLPAHIGEIGIMLWLVIVGNASPEGEPAVATGITRACYTVTATRHGKRLRPRSGHALSATNPPRELPQVRFLRAQRRGSGASPLR